jgi:hypothetical protein
MARRATIKPQKKHHNIMGPDNSLMNAKKRLKKLKDFYGHLTAFLFVNIPLVGGYVYYRDSLGLGNTSNTLHWLDWNMVLVPVVWSVFLLFQAACTFGWVRKWEARQMAKFMEREQKGNSWNN